MFRLRLLPWDYGIRNLFRRPGRSALTLAALTLVVMLVFVVVGFIRGLEASLTLSGDPQVVLIHSLGSSENVENSSVPARTAALFSASFDSIQRRRGPAGQNIAYVSPELYLGTQMNTEADREGALGLVRGVTPAALLVRRNIQIIEGRWPGPGEVLVGRLAATKLGRGADELALGRVITFEGRSWRISGRFTSAGSALEAEAWCALDELQQALKRQDHTMVAIALAASGNFADVDEFCKERLDLELQATPETAYYAALHNHYAPVRYVAWVIVAMVGGAGVFAGLNTMYGAVVGRVRELATLQAIGFNRGAIALSLIQEATVLAASGSLIAALIAVAMLNGLAVRFTMGAFLLRIDSASLAIGFAVGILLGICGAIPPAIRAMRSPVAEGLKAV